MDRVSPLPGGIAHDAAKPRPWHPEQNKPLVENMFYYEWVWFEQTG